MKPSEAGFEFSLEINLNLGRSLVELEGIAKQRGFSLADNPSLRYTIAIYN